MIARLRATSADTATTSSCSPSRTTWSTTSWTSTRGVARMCLKSRWRITPSVRTSATSTTMSRLWLSATARSGLRSRRWGRLISGPSAGAPPSSFRSFATPTPPQTSPASSQRATQLWVSTPSGTPSG
eukprot:Amastigsp_a844163_8.p2 type:complete len:128 gc:universal Amastigsp_a844163_8:282-665(+)